MTHTLPENPLPPLARGNGITAELFARLVCAAARVCGTTPEIVLSSCRVVKGVRARSLIVLSLRERLGCPWSQIAALFGRPHHSALLESSKQIALEIQRQNVWFASRDAPPACIRADAALQSVEACLAETAKGAERGRCD